CARPKSYYVMDYW
nr:immunoglobulin heavy chain junction region [Mus musculus]MBK4195558.1 immunoglobulin heavy chain junction region [Mus musculus]